MSDTYALAEMAREMVAWDVAAAAYRRGDPQTATAALMSTVPADSDVRTTNTALVTSTLVGVFQCSMQLAVNAGHPPGAPPAGPYRAFRSDPSAEPPAAEVIAYRALEAAANGDFDGAAAALHDYVGVTPDRPSASRCAEVQSYVLRVYADLIGGAG